MNKNPKVGLALGSGAARGLAHIGVLKVLEENKIPIDFIAGTSMGALIGATYAAGLDVEQIEEIACNTDWKLTARLFLPTLPRSGFVEGKRIKDFLKALMGDPNIDTLKVPFAVVATDLLTGEEIVIHKGSLVEAVRASISIPVIFTPVRHQNRFLVDGGLVNPVPTSVAAKMGVDVIIAVNVIPSVDIRMKRIRMKNEERMSFSKKALSSAILENRLSKYIQDKLEKSALANKIENLFTKNAMSKKEVKAPNLIDVVMQTVHIAENEICLLRLKQSQPDILIEPEVNAVGLLEFFKAPEA
ncbi:MAG: patatin-like phospholipase family protein, partial [candidate division Zixibacteria bacterium]|nr:patatin-like phospholipase family protein [candidate division Zixibacteria bacterium]